MEPVLSLEKVSKEYLLGEETLYAMRDMTVTIHQGEFVTVVGPSGSGKSTFLHLASLLDTASSGVIKILKTDVTNYSEVERARLRNKSIGFIFQQFNLLPKTSALENVGLPLLYAGVSKTEREQRATQALEEVGLGDRLLNTPAQLSGGQQQRVAIARALVNNPSIIFADEPTGNLDTKSGKDIRERLLYLHKSGKTIIMVTHDQELAEIGNRKLTIVDGALFADTAKGKKK